MIQGHVWHGEVRLFGLFPVIKGLRAHSRKEIREWNREGRRWLWRFLTTIKWRKIY